MFSKHASGLHFSNLRQFISELQKQKQIIEINAQVDPYLELAEIHRRIILEGGHALLFNNVKGHAFPVVTNLFGTKERTDLAFGNNAENFIKRIVKLPETVFPFSFSKLWQQLPLIRQGLRIGLRYKKNAPVLEISKVPPNLSELPIITSWPKDGGPFITLPLVYTEHPESKIPNLGMYRAQRFSDEELGLHFQIAKGGEFHLAAARHLRQTLPVNIFVGGPPAAILSAIAPLPENISELLLCSLLLNSHVDLTSSPLTNLPLLAEAEFAIIGECSPFEKRPEGPFGDHYGYYSLQHDFPFMRCRAIYHRKNAIYPATVVGKPRQEDYYIGQHLQRLLSPIFPLVMPLVKDLWSYGETGFHSLATARVNERYKREAMTAALRILGEGQLSLTKFLLVIDAVIDLENFPMVFEYVLARANFATDLYIISHLSLDTLDYTGPKLNEGSRGILLGLGEPIRMLAREFCRPLPSFLKSAKVFCGGCLVVSAEDQNSTSEIAELIARDPTFSDWPIVILVDNVEFSVTSSENFLWSVFTRFNPASDIVARQAEIKQAHISFTPPIVIDSRMKATYPECVECSDETKHLVDKRWREYFP